MAKRAPITPSRDKGCSQSNCPKDHRAHLRSPELELVVVRGGKNAYLWVGESMPSGRCFGTMQGHAALRAFAKAILAEVGDTPKRDPRTDELIDEGDQE